MKIEKEISLYVHTSSMKIFNPVTEKSVFGLAHESNFKNLDYACKDDHLEISFVGKQYKYPLESRLLKRIKEKGKLNLSVINDYVSLEKKENAFEVEGKVLLIKNLFQRKALYLSVEGQETPLMVYVDKDFNIKLNDKLKVYLPLDYISLTDDSGVPMLANYEIKNKVSGEDLLLLKKKLQLKEASSYEIPIEGISILHKKEKIEKKDYHIFKVVILDTEQYQGKSIIYYRVKGMKGYLTAMLDEEIDMVKTPTLKLMIKR